MKNLHLLFWICSLLIFSSSTFGQTTPDNRALRLGIVLPSLSFEQRIIGSLSADIRTSLTGYWEGQGRNRLFVNASVGLNVQYNLRKWQSKEKSLSHFSGNFLSFRNGYLTSIALNEGNRSPMYSTTHTLEHLWRRAIGRHAYFELGGGGGIFFTTNYGGIELMPTLRLSIGFSL